MSDLISRQDALDILDDFEADIELGKRDSYKAHREKLLSFPSSEPKTGTWVRKDDGLFFWYECSECGNKPMANRFSYREERSAFCPHCGADMRGEKHG